MAQSMAKKFNPLGSGYKKFHRTAAQIFKDKVKNKPPKPIPYGVSNSRIHKPILYGVHPPTSRTRRNGK